MANVLEGIRIIDLSRVISGPFATMLLADMGAEVIKIEGPEGEDARTSPPRKGDGSLYWISHNRNKKSVTLNLRTDRGKEILRQLVRQADVVVENFRPGVIAQIGFDYPRLKALKDDIIMLSISGFGQTGPYASRPAYDQIVQAMSGIAWVTGHPEMPPVHAGVYIGDYLPAVYAAFGVTLALFHRQRTGQGQQVDVAMLDSLVSTLCIPIANHLVNGALPERRGNKSLAGPGAPNNTYQLADGYVHILAITDDHFQRLCRALGRDDWATSERYASRTDREHNGDEFDAALAEELRPRKVAEVMVLAEKFGFACGPVQSIPQVVSDPQVRARDMITEVYHPTMGKVPVGGITVKLSETPGEVRLPPPLLGAHNREVLGGLLGYSDAEVEAFRAAGVI
jgi:CoA:oxalate CoA-transferase